jgi:hypothetical protein
MNDDGRSRPNSGGLAQPAREFATEVESELQTGESLIWVGQPRQEPYAKASGCLFVFGMLFIGAGVVLIMLGIVFLFRKGAGGGGLSTVGILLAGLFGIYFVLTGVRKLAAPIWMKRRGKGTRYLLTDQRAIVWEPTFLGPKVRSFGRDELRKMTRVENDDGSGSLIFQEDTIRDNDGFTKLRHGFLNIDNALAVEELIRRTLLA